MSTKITFTVQGRPLDWAEVIRYTPGDPQGDWVKPISDTQNALEQQIVVEIPLSEAGLYRVQGAGRREWWSIAALSAVQIEEVQAGRLLGWGSSAPREEKIVHPDILPYLSGE